MRFDAYSKAKVVWLKGPNAADMGDFVSLLIGSRDFSLTRTENILPFSRYVLWVLDGGATSFFYNIDFKDLYIIAPFRFAKYSDYNGIVCFPKSHEECNIS